MAQWVLIGQHAWRASLEANVLLEKPLNNEKHLVQRKCSGYNMIYLLTAVGLTPGGSSTVHIYTQTVHRTTQLTTRRTQQNNTINKSSTINKNNNAINNRTTQLTRTSTQLTTEQQHN